MDSNLPNFRTASQYVAAARWACKSFGLSGSLDTDIATNTIRTTFTMQTLLVTNMVREVVKFAQDDKATAVLALFFLTG